ncbi:HEXXH motif-containing putative peptide modification protein [Streptomyces sp. NPDC059766]|uniref:aKG-HExxH-type peptide beta-hydroxylase n=1 Tax=Streptomyces sp. NPDC059766 TaxID=3346940 RepID=UPI00365BFE5C
MHRPGGRPCLPSRRRTTTPPRRSRRLRATATSRSSAPRPPKTSTVCSPAEAACADCERIVAFTDTEEGTELRYAPWRDDPRPVDGRFKGVCAFLAVVGFWRPPGPSPRRPGCRRCSTRCTRR